jgi:hypothetical protein
MRAARYGKPSVHVVLGATRDFDAFSVAISRHGRWLRITNQEAFVSDFQRQGFAVVIEVGDMVQMLCDTLNSFGYHAISAPTHAKAAERALAYDRIDLLVACVPAPDESRAGIYLEEASRRNSHMAVLLMLADPLEQPTGAPERAVRIVKPFGHKTLIAAIEMAEEKADQS